VQTYKRTLSYTHPPTCEVASNVKRQQAHLSIVPIAAGLEILFARFEVIRSADVAQSITERQTTHKDIVHGS
jgi:hypothetical protein